MMADTRSVKRTPEQDHAEKERIEGRETRRLLRDLVSKAVPPVPRRMNRIGELFGFCLEVARKNGWLLSERRQQLTLLRLVIVQLLAPDLYRFGRRHYRLFLSKLETWCEEYGTPVNLTLVEDDVRTRIEENTKALKDKPDDPVAAGELYTLRRLDQELLKLVRLAQQHRSRFDPFNLIDPVNPCDGDIHRYFSLESGAGHKPFIGVAAPSQVGVMAESGSGEFGHAVSAPDNRVPAAPSDPDGFFNQLFSTDEVAWRNAIEHEAERLTGRVLDDASFRTLLDRVRRAPQFVNVRWVSLLEPYLTADQFVALYRESKLLQHDAGFRTLLDQVRGTPQVVSVRWVELLEPYLTADQFVALYRESKLLQRLNDAMPGAKPS